ncbi:MAG: diaminopimelate epimerase [Victivallales bacterium]|nr:diaminopimelate epimerase [Victivallales bacterium]
MKMRKICFTKAHGCGNDFIILNNFNRELEKFGVEYSNLARKLCRRKYSIGADGLIIFDKSNTSDYFMHIYDSDGTKEDMCGNAARCTALYGSSLGMGNKFKFETGAGLMEAYVNENTVKVKMTEPKDYTPNIKLSIDGKEIVCHHINTGISHMVVFTEENGIKATEEFGRKIRNHEFSLNKGGSCVNFISRKEDGSTLVHTYETGVEEITNACGTGCTAAALILSLIKDAKTPVKLQTPGEDYLTIHFKKTENFVTEVYKEGQAVLLGDGIFTYTENN